MFHTNRKLPVVLCMLVSIAGAAAAQDAATLPDALAEKVETAQEECAAFENGQFSLDWGAVTRVDLNGDHDLDWVLDEFRFRCSSAASLYCGTGGCMSHFLVDGTVHSILNQGWDIVTLGPFRVLLADVHGSQCGGINPTPCVTASTWDPEARIWRSAAAAWE